MWDEEAKPKPAATAWQAIDLTRLSKEELKVFQDFCREEIIRAEAELNKRSQAENAAAAVFKK